MASNEGNTVMRGQWKGLHRDDNLEFSQFLPSSQRIQDTSGVELSNHVGGLERVLQMKFPRFLRLESCIVRCALGDALYLFAVATVLSVACAVLLWRICVLQSLLVQYKSTAVLGHLSAVQRAILFTQQTY